MNTYDTIVIGSGCAGAVAARILADKGQKVLVLERRGHVGGNCFDQPDKHGILIHQYGPHIFHTNKKEVYDYLSRYTRWYPYSHEVVGYVDGNYLPVPFNLNSLELVYGKEKAQSLERKLKECYGEGSRVAILELRKNQDEEIQELAEYVYQNIFLKYTMKQWGQKPEEVDQSVTARVPVLISRDNRYFQDEYQGMPSDGYTRMFENMLFHENIEMRCDTEAKRVLKFGEKILFQGKEFDGNVIYTGAIDELFDCCYGRLPYRSLDFVFEYLQQDEYQPKAVVNYTVSEDYTRITEFKKLTGQRASGTTIVKEYPQAYEGKEGQIPYYAILNEENLALYQKYKELTKKYKKMHLLGRLAEYKYYNIDGIVEKAMELAEGIEKNEVIKCGSTML